MMDKSGAARKAQYLGGYGVLFLGVIFMIMLVVLYLLFRKSLFA